MPFFFSFLELLPLISLILTQVSRAEFCPFGLVFTGPYMLRGENQSTPKLNLFSQGGLNTAENGTPERLRGYAAPSPEVGM